MKIKIFIKENWFKLIIVFILILNSYYLIIYLKTMTQISWDGLDLRL